jgi:predicted transcriptional regulator
MSTTPTIESLLAQFQALGAQLAALNTAKATEAPAVEPAPRTLSSTAAERIRQLVYRQGRCTMPELQRELKLEKSAAHYYARKLATEGRVELVYEPHAASHSLVLVAYRDVDALVSHRAKAEAPAKAG